MDDKLTPVASASATLITRPGIADILGIEGRFTVECFDANGALRWSDDFLNTVVTVGKNAMLDAALAGSAYTVTGPFMGLISSTSFTAISASDTMASHTGWLEAGGANAPTYTGNRQTCVWSAASGGAKALSVALSYTMTGGGTLKGAFITYGSGALATKDNTAGTLFSAGLFTGGDRAVLTSDVVNVSYSVSL